MRARYYLCAWADIGHHFNSSLFVASVCYISVSLCLRLLSPSLSPRLVVVREMPWTALWACVEQEEPIEIQSFRAAHAAEGVVSPAWWMKRRLRSNTTVLELGPSLSLLEKSRGTMKRDAE